MWCSWRLWEAGTTLPAVSSLGLGAINNNGLDSGPVVRGSFLRAVRAWLPCAGFRCEPEQVCVRVRVRMIPWEWFLCRRVCVCGILYVCEGVCRVFWERLYRRVCV